mmetsp:Transcript_8690/g.12563  ORF Transcript_8690/g.12563 Transcript_8690/m.12563 type:complete len:1106 (+) Transcript_8690:73-3390(+)
MPSSTTRHPRYANVDKRSDYAKKNGLCPKCFETQVCEREKGRMFFDKKWVPIQEGKNRGGRLIVYKGYCLNPTCYSLEEVKMKLREIDPFRQTLPAQLRQTLPTQLRSPRNLLGGSIPKTDGNTSDHKSTEEQMAEAENNLDYRELVRLLENQQSREEPIKVGLFLLCRIAYKGRLQNRRTHHFGNDGWVKSLTTVINCYSDHQEIQKLAVSVLASLCYLSREYMTDVVRHGGVNFVLSVMKKNEEKLAILDACCCAIYFMVDTEISRQRDDCPQQTGLLLQDHNGTKAVEQLVSAISLSDSNEAKRWAMDALANFALQGYLSEDGRSLSEIVQNAENGNGVRIIINSMKVDNTDSRLASSALSLLCIISEELAIAPSEDLVEILLTVSQKTNKCSIHHAFLNLLGYLAFELQVLYNTKLLCDLVDIVIIFLGVYQEREELQMAAIRALISIMYPSKHRQKILEWNAPVSAVINTMEFESFQHNKGLQTLGIHAIAIMASENDQCKLCVVNSKGISTITKAVRRFALNSRNNTEEIDELKILACTFIAQIAASPVTCPALNEEGVIPLFLDVVQSMPRGLPDSVKSAVLTLSRNGADLYGNRPNESSALRALESLMTSAVLEEAEIKASMVELSKLCETSPEIVKSLIVADDGCGLDRVENIMTNTRYLNEVDVQAAGCVIFAATFKLFSFCGRFGEPTQFEVGKSTYSVVVHSAKYVSTIREALSQHSSKAPIVTSAMMALGALLLGPTPSSEDDKVVFDDIAKLSFRDSLEECLEILATYQSEFEIICVCIWYLRSIISLIDTMEIKVCGSRLFEQILEILHMHESTELRINACCALLSLIYKEQDDETISSIEGQLLANSLIICFRDDSEELVEVSSELTALIIYRAVKFVEDIIDAQDSIRTIIGCMVRNKELPDIICNCCMILASISALHDEDDLLLVIEHGGLNVILDVMDHHNENKILTENSSKALLAIVKGNPSSDLPPKIAQTIIRVMEENTGNPDVTSSLLETIWHLGSRNNMYFDQFSKKRTISSIIDTMNLNIPDANVQGAGCAALWSLAIHGDNKQLIGDCGGLESVTNALMAHLDSFRIQKEGASLVNAWL